MRGLFCFFLFIFFCIAYSARAQVRSEGEVIETIIRSLQTQDSRSYIDLFPQTDTLARWVLQRADPHSDAYQQMLYLSSNYNAKIDFDTTIKHEAEKRFDDFLKAGESVGVHWEHIVFVRYELEKIRYGRDIISEKVSSLRFLGYVFIKDMLNRKTYALTVFDIMQVNNMWYGGELANIFEASTKEDFAKAYRAEVKRLREQAQNVTDTTDLANDENAADDDEDDEEHKMPRLKEIMDRKFYRGKFDNEIIVQLYVRHIKGNCPEVICSWEALFKFGDQDEWVPMEVSKTGHNKWLFTEELGGMELELKDKTFTGGYASSSDKTEYDVKFTEADISLKKIEALDAQLEAGGEE